MPLPVNVHSVLFACTTIAPSCLQTLVRRCSSLKTLIHLSYLLRLRGGLPAEFNRMERNVLFNDAISRSSQCTTTGVTKTVVCTILSVGWCI